ARDREDIELSLPEKRVGIPRLYRHRPIARLDGSTLPFHRASPYSYTLEALSPWHAWRSQMSTRFFPSPLVFQHQRTQSVTSCKVGSYRHICRPKWTHSSRQRLGFFLVQLETRKPA